MNDQTPKPGTEADDAKLIDAGLQALSGGDVNRARAIFADVAGRAPAVYHREAVRDGTLYVKFWDVEEFTHYVTAHQGRITTKVVWLPSVYPRAMYYLGFVAVKQNRPAAALEILDAAAKLEPHPTILAERGKALASLGRHDEAMASYQAVLARGDEVRGKLRALALRGVGFQLIELNRLDEAEAAFGDSLTLDPDSPVARNELTYIDRLRRGGPAAPVQTVARETVGPLACAACGGKVDGGRVFNASGRLIWLCPACVAAVARDGRPGQAPSVTIHVGDGPAPFAPARRPWWRFWR